MTTDLAAQFDVTQGGFYAALRAIKPHVAGPDDVPALAHVEVRVEPDGNLYLIATDRYTAGIACANIVEDHLGTGETVNAYLSGAKDIPDLLGVFKPGKDSDPGDIIRVEITKGTFVARLVRGMISMPGDRLLEICPAHIEDYPDVRRVVSAGIVQAVCLRETATQNMDHTGRTDLSPDVVGEVFVQAQLLRRFTAAAQAYGAPLVIQRTAEARSGMLVSAGEHFVGMLMPANPSPEAMAAHRFAQGVWMRHLPDPQAAPVQMPAHPKADEEDEEHQGEDDAGPGQASIPDGELEPELVADAANIVATTQFGSVSMLQRKLRIGWEAAEHVMSELERLGVVAPASQPGRARDVLIDPDDAADVSDHIRRDLDTQARHTGALITDTTGLAGLSKDTLIEGSGALFSDN